MFSGRIATSMRCRPSSSRQWSTTSATAVGMCRPHAAGRSSSRPARSSRSHRRCCDGDLAGEHVVDGERERQARPSRAWRRRSRTIARKVRGAEASPGGTVASHGFSHSALRRRTSFHARASLVASGRSPTRPARRWTRQAFSGARFNGRSRRSARRRAEQRDEHGEPVLDAPAGPGRFTTSAWPRTPASPRDSAAVGTPLPTPCARIASAMPGTSRSSSGRVTSGVRSVGVRPVPPVVTTTRAPPSIAARMASATGSPSGTTTGPVTSKPRPVSASTISGPVVSS